MTAEQVNLYFGIALIVAVGLIALAALIAAMALLRVGRDIRHTARAAEKVLASVDQELPAALRDLRATSAQLARLAEEVPPRLERVDGLLDEATASVQSLRATIETAEDIVRGPQAALDRASRTVRDVGVGLARGADRLMRGVQQRRGGGSSGGAEGGAGEGRAD
ncbi:MAG TPA: hypothetical protein VMZ33_03200 [Candidatus Limnocylindrales bacterium]|nr:hypothetical protein [Candidatus Limnocylindrales bacterium]